MRQEGGALVTGEAVEQHSQRPAQHAVLGVDHGDALHGSRARRGMGEKADMGWRYAINPSICQSLILDWVT